MENYQAMDTTSFRGEYIAEWTTADGYNAVETIQNQVAGGNSTNESIPNSPAPDQYPQDQSMIPPPPPIPPLVTPIETNIPPPSTTKIEPMETEEPIPIYEQTGSVVCGPGSQKEALLLGLDLPRLSHRQYDDLSRAKKYAMEQSVKHVLMKQTISHQQQQQKMAMYSQALSLMARVYVGSISFELREDTIKNAFAPFGPIKSVNMSWDPVTGHHKGFAFLEYELPEAAQLAQDQMNGLLIGGRNLKARPPECRFRAQPIIDMIIEDAKKFNRVYVSSIHPDLSEVDVKSVFEAFGTIKSIDLAKGPGAGKHRGYAFIEYETEQAALDAIASMNMFDLGGQHLRVGQAITPPQAKEYIAPAPNSTLPTASAVAAAAVTAKIQAMDPTLSLQTTPPRVVVGTPPPAGGLGAQVFSVPPPGIAVPQLPVVTRTQTTPSSPLIAVPQLSSVPHVSSASSVSSGSPSNVQGLTTTAPVSLSKFHPPPVAPVALAPVFNPSTPAQLAVPPPGIFIPPPPTMVIPPAPMSIPTLPRTVAPQSAPLAAAGQQEPKQLNAAQSAARAAAQRLQTPAKTSPAPSTTAINAPPVLTEQQKQILDQEAIQTLAAQEDLKIKGNEARNILMHKLMRRTESCVLVLRNMVGPEEVDDTLQDEVEEECSKYGRVKEVVIYQEKPSDTAPAIVKIFVRYNMALEADTAKNALDGRFFGGRQVKAQIYDQNLFEHQDLSG